MNRIINFVLCSVSAGLLSTVFCAPLFAGDGIWTPIMPEGGVVSHSAVAVDGAIIVATGRRVFKSEDGGASWEAGHIFESNILDLAVDPDDASVILASTGFNGIQMSEDGGNTFEVVALDQAHWVNDTFIRDLSVRPDDPDRWFAVSDDLGVIASSDGGDSWAPIDEQPTGAAETLVIAPGSPDTMYVGTRADGISISTDGGASWTQINNGLDLDQSYGVIAVSPDDPGTVVAGGRCCRSLFRTTDSGATWSFRGSLAPNGALTGLAFDPQDSDLVFAIHDSIDVASPIWKSSDGGSTWAELTDPDTTHHGPELYTIQVDGSDILLGSRHGVLLSSDTGATWSTSNAGLRGTLVDDFTLVAGSQDRIYAASRTSGVLRSDDAGATWASLNSGIELRDVSTVAMSPMDPDTLFVNNTFERSLLRSTDGGATWTDVPDDFLGAPTSVPVVAIHPTDDLIVLAWDENNEAVIRSTDQGDSWVDVTAGFPGGSLAGHRARVLEFAPSDGSIVYMGTSESAFRSEDGGVTWTDVSATLPSDAHVFAVAIHPEDPDTVAVGLFFQGVYISTNGGVDWVLQDTNLPDTSVTGYSIAFDPADGDHIVFGGSPIGFHFSENGGATWLRQITGMTPISETGSFEFEGVAVDPVVSERYFASTRGELQVYSGSLVEDEEGPLDVDGDGFKDTDIYVGATGAAKEPDDGDDDDSDDSGSGSDDSSGGGSGGSSGGGSGGGSTSGGGGGGALGAGFLVLMLSGLLGRKSEGTHRFDRLSRTTSHPSCNASAWSLAPGSGSCMGGIKHVSWVSALYPAGAPSQSKSEYSASSSGVSTRT